MKDCEHPKLTEYISNNKILSTITLQCPDCSDWISYLGDYERETIMKLREELDKQPPIKNPPKGRMVTLFGVPIFISDELSKEDE